MPSHILTLVLAALVVPGAAATPSVLLEACNALDDPAKRLECLKAAVGGSSTQQDERKSSPPLRGSYAPPSGADGNTLAPSFQATPSPRTGVRAPSSSAGDSTCYVGPRGGTYTITKSGRKNYSGC